MKIDNNYAVIMAGGIGARFWPMSNSNSPKQFLDILGTGESLIQQTFRRLINICPKENIFVVTNKKYKNLCKKQLPEIENKNILCEPRMRNTAPCIAYAAFRILGKNPKANLIITPSDHLIINEKSFEQIVKDCFLKYCEKDILITIGIKPNRPDTGYGYIQFDESKKSDILKRVKRFSEKPSQALALQFIDSGEFLWNSGIFICNIQSILKSYHKYLPEMYDIFLKGETYYNTSKEQEFIDNNFPYCKNISIDYGIMEKANNVYVYPGNFGWSDLGTWGSLYNHLELDQKKNAIQGGKIFLYNSSNNIIKIPENKIAVLHGLDGYIIVEQDNILLVCKKEDEQEIKKFLADITS